MKITVIGSHLCPDTLYALHHLTAIDADVTFQDILSCHAALQSYLKIRETSELYSAIRGTERLGIPCFVKEAGTMTLALDDILA